MHSPLFGHRAPLPKQVARCIFIAGSMLLAVAAGAQAQSASEPSIEQVTVSGRHIDLHSGTGNTADLLEAEGVNFSSAGGISSLPVVRGLNDDRIRLVVDGAETTSACANHMNPPLSYVDASRVEAVEVMAGITPVSQGGDSIGGTISITTEQPRYADSDEALLFAGSLAYFHRSNNHNHGLALSATLASEQLSLTYSDSIDQAESYHDGNGDKVLDTLYRSDNQSITLGVKGEQQSLILKLTHQEVPYQGFPNQYMDMAGNISNGVNLQYTREFNWGRLDGQLSWQDVEHEMGFFTKEKPGTMPMLTEGEDVGYKIAVELPVTNASTLRLGHEWHRFSLDDWWPAVPGSMMMGPEDFININNGERSRYAFYIENDYTINTRWQTLAGMRYEYVVTDTDEVQPYRTSGMMNLDAAAATAFNSTDRRRKDDNVDLTLVARYAASQKTQIDFGYARKTRSPNLYERYSWGRNTMAMTMIGWYGDGNGYVGDIDLDAEIAHTLSATWRWRSADETREVAATPYYTFVDDFIDAQQIGSFHPRMAMAVTRPLLQFTNVDADLYGIEVRAHRQLMENRSGKLVVRAGLDYTRGERHADNSDLYHIMPLTVDVSLQHRRGDWTNTLTVEWMDSKRHVDELRMENQTDHYTLVDIGTAYQWQQLTISLDVRNLLDRHYDLPLGGVYLSGWLASDQSAPFASLPGEGRSLDVGVRYRF